MIPSSPKLRDDVGRKEFRVASRYVDIGVFDMQKRIQHILELVYVLHFVKQNEIVLLVDDLAMHILA